MLLHLPTELKKREFTKEEIDFVMKEFQFSESEQFSEVDIRNTIKKIFAKKYIDEYMSRCTIRAWRADWVIISFHNLDKLMLNLRVKNRLTLKLKDLYIYEVLDEEQEHMFIEMKDGLYDFD